MYFYTLAWGGVFVACQKYIQLLVQSFIRRDGWMVEQCNGWVICPLKDESPGTSFPHIHIFSLTLYYIFISSDYYCDINHQDNKSNVRAL